MSSLHVTINRLLARLTQLGEPSTNEPNHTSLEDLDELELKHIWTDLDPIKEKMERDTRRHKTKLHDDIHAKLLVLYKRTNYMTHTIPTNPQYAPILQSIYINVVDSVQVILKLLREDKIWHVTQKLQNLITLMHITRALPVLNVPAFTQCHLYINVLVQMLTEIKLLSFHYSCIPHIDYETQMDYVYFSLRVHSLIYDTITTSSASPSRGR
jgi:hypothetical protein